MRLCKRGNVQVRHACKLIRKLVNSGKSGYLENPRPSRVWAVIERLLADLFMRKLASYSDTNMCMYSGCWKKPTRIMHWGPNHSNVKFRCCFGHSGCCSRTGKPHEQLVGSRNGVFVTSLAQVYSKPFAADLMTQITKKP